MNIIVTGASKGIGKEMVKLFCRDGKHNVLAISRNKQYLEVLKSEVNHKENLKILDFDLNQVLSEDHNFFNIVNNIFEHIDILINNAGVLVNKAFSDTTTDEAIAMFNTNFFVSTRLMSGLLPLLMKSSNAHVVNIGSMAGFQGSAKYPGLAYYSASKAALAGITECLAQEYYGSTVKFNCLAIGAVQTEMLNQAFPGYKAPLNPQEMASFIVDFAQTGQRFFNGKVIPVALTNPS